MVRFTRQTSATISYWPDHLVLKAALPFLRLGFKPAETEQYTFKSSLNASEKPVMDVTGRVSHVSMHSSSVVTLNSDDGTDTVRATELGDVMSATMQDKSATEALSPKKNRNTII